MAIIKQYHKDTDTTYVYDSQSYWDPEKGQSRSKRKLLGKLDPVTGEIIPTGKRGRKKTKKEDAHPPIVSEASESSQNIADRQLILEQQLTIQELKSRVEILTRENQKYKNDLHAVVQFAQRFDPYSEESK